MGAARFLGASIVAFVGLSAHFGLHIQYRFEVAAIAIVWLTLLVAGVLLALVFARSTRDY